MDEIRFFWHCFFAFHEFSRDPDCENRLFVSSLVLGFSEKFLVLVLAHLFLAPFYNAPHTLTSF